MMTSIERLEEQILNNDMGVVPLFVYAFLEEAKEMHKVETLQFVRTMPKEKGITQEGEAYVQYDAEKHYNELYKN